ncbi:hypothetical protein L798_09066 [Zootermopsis nevadensis]|uniref:Uncharacterized protein n=1 Tax=Zootermopsis nevadensis TaxID=136037 RepID=A0A067R2F6_ZOONE|nr:hypothetical protein L798_09066 [Zootermopsis nevadensis]
MVCCIHQAGTGEPPLGRGPTHKDIGGDRAAEFVTRVSKIREAASTVPRQLSSLPLKQSQPCVERYDILFLCYVPAIGNFPV